MANFHPDSRVLNDYAAGSLPLAQSVCVSMHLDYCDHCQRQTKQLQHLGAGMFEKLSPEPVKDDLLDSVLARLDDTPPLSYSTTVAPLDIDSHPALLKRLMQKDYDDLEWRRIGSNLQISHLKPGDPAHEMALYHIKAGGSIPEHTHRGSELTLVLEGSFSDEEGVYQQGDFLMHTFFI